MALKKIDYKAMSKETGLHAHTLRRILSGDKNITLQSMKKVSTATGVDIQELFFTEGKTPEQVLTA